MVEMKNQKGFSFCSFSFNFSNNATLARPSSIGVATKPALALSGGRRTGIQ